MTRKSGTARIVISAVVLAVAGVVAVLMLASRSTGSAMSGMDHSSGDTAMSSPAPTTAGDMPGTDMSGMDHSSGDPTASPAPTTSGDMAGMEHGSGEMPGSTPSPSMSGDMAGMEHGSGEMPGSTPSPSMSGDMAGMDHGSGDSPARIHDDETTEAASDRPLAPVLGAFGGGASAVMLSARFLRRRDHARSQAKAAARAARRSAK